MSKSTLLFYGSHMVFRKKTGGICQRLLLSHHEEVSALFESLYEPLEPPF